MLSTRQLQQLRQRAGLGKDDTSQDAEIQALPPMTILKHLAAWNLGSPDWADQFIEWAEGAGFTVINTDDLADKLQSNYAFGYEDGYLNGSDRSM